MTVSFESTVAIAAPPERVFHAMTDLEGARQWMKGLVRIEPLQAGPLRQGARWRETRKMMGHEATEEFEVTALEAPRRISLFCDGTKGTTGKGEFRFDYEITPDGSGSKIRMCGSITMPGFFAKLFGRLFVGMFRSMCTKDLLSMKAHLEGSRGA